MKLLRRNTKEFEYLPWTGEETDVDESGRHTGNYVPTYGTAVIMRGNISIPGGHLNQTFYGQNIRYTHTLLMDDENAQISETGRILWNGHRYEIRAVRRSLNGLSAALMQMTDDNAEEDTP